MKKPMFDIKFIFHKESPLTFYKQYHKGGLRLNIDVHGSPYEYGQGGLHVGNAIYSPGMLYDWLKSVSDLKSVYAIRLVSCFSAFGGRGSFICRFSRLVPDIYIKGYMDEVYTKMAPGAIGVGLRELGVNKTIENLLEVFPDGPPAIDKFDEKFCSVTYKNGVLIKTTERKSNIAIVHN